MSAAHRVHVVDDGADVEVWLDTQVADFDGLCLGGGASVEEAIADALEELHAAVAQLDPTRARMNAAAPELLAALHDAAKVITALLGSAKDDWWANSPTAQRVRAAIAKAEGRA